VIRYHSGLDRVQLSAFRQVLDGHDLSAVNLAQKEDAGIHRLIVDTSATHMADRYRAGSAVALSAALLRSDPAFLKSQIVQERCARVKARNFDGLSIPPEADCVSYQDLPPPGSSRPVMVSREE
jgi:hypothetical protein